MRMHNEPRGAQHLRRHHVWAWVVGLSAWGGTGCIAEHRSQDPAEADARLASDGGDGLVPTEDAAEVGDCGFEIKYFETSPADLPEPRVVGTQVLAHRLNAEHRPQAVDLETGAPVGGPEDVLVDADGAARLLLRPDGAGQSRLIYREAGRDRVLSEAGARRYAFEPGINHQVEPGGAAWIENDAIFALRAGQAGPIWLGPAFVIALRDGHVVWVNSGDQRVHVAPPAAEEQIIGPAEGTARLVPTRGYIWWLSGGRPWVWVHGTLEGHAVGTLADCEALDAEGDQALVTCHPPPGEGVLTRITAAGAQQEIQRGPALVGARITPDGLAWARYPDADAWCTGRANGGLWWWPAGHRAPEVVAEVSSGCLCCNAYWPPLQIDMGPGLLAWNYPVSPSPAGVGVARCLAGPQNP